MSDFTEAIVDDLCKRVDDYITKREDGMIFLNVTALASALESAGVRDCAALQKELDETKENVRFATEQWQREMADAVDLRATNAKLRAVVDEQADDGGLWFVPETAPEDYLQRALRRLHAAIEGDKQTLSALDTPDDTGDV